MTFSNAKTLSYVNGIIRALVDPIRGADYEHHFEYQITLIFEFCAGLGKTEDEIYAHIIAELRN